MKSANSVILLLACFTLKFANAQCHNDEVLVGEDDKNWYCGKQATPDDVREVSKGLDERLGNGPQGMLGEEWRFRKAVIEAAGKLLREHYPTYYGGKITISEKEGGAFNICVGNECTGFTGRGVDCSGFLEFSFHSACVLNGFYKGSANYVLPEGNAAAQAVVFQKAGAFIPKNGFPDSGDAVFFKDTTRGNSGRITHVALYLGKTLSGRKMIMNTSYDPKHKKVVFMSVPGNYEEKIVGYGNISKLYMDSH